MMAGGRKLEFDKIQALDAAMQMFWTKGYQGTSLSDLTGTMGINKPSMYATFGNKEALFIKATDHYLEYYAKPKTDLLYESGKTLKKRLKNYLMAVLKGQCDDRFPKGCYLALCIGESGGRAIPDDAQAAVEEAGAFPLNHLEKFLKTDSEAIKLSLNRKAKDKALFLITILNGTAALARADYSENDLEPVIDRALAALGI